MKWKKRNAKIHTMTEYYEEKHKMSIAEFLKRKSHEIVGSEKAAAFIKKYADRFFTVVGDYDVDGITSSKIMEIGLNRLGIKTKIRIPKRLSEGYGINNTIVDEIPEDSVVITVDNGIVAFEQIEELKKKGCKVLLTDHHLPAMEGDNMILPPADIIVNPHVNKNGQFEDYCGAAVAYKIMEKLLPENDVVMPLLLAYAAMATVADQMPLVDENRFLVADGLEVLNGKKGIITKGLSALISMLPGDCVKAETIGFYLAPMLNAMGRMYDDGATIAMNTMNFNGGGLPKEDGIRKAVEMAAELKKVNDQRKEIEKNAMQMVEEYIDPENIAAPIIVYLPVNEGILGLIAAKLVKKYNVPVLVLSDAQEEGLYKGSARSVEGVNLKELFDRHADAFYAYGGHEGAAGFTVEKERLNDLKVALQGDEEMQKYVANEVEYYDLEITPENLGKAYASLEKMQPLGRGNEEPVFAIKGVKPEKISYMGNEGQHVKFAFENGEAIAFNMAEEFRELSKNGLVNLYGKVSVNEFRGQVTYQLRVEGMDVAA